MPPDAPPAASIPTPTPAEVAKRDDWFTRTPDPWNEIVLLQYGGDRTCATSVERAIVHAGPQQWPAFEQRLVETLARPELTDAGRQFVCRMLGLIGGPACVPAVLRLLEDDRTADTARTALDGIGDPAVDAGYREALGRLHGRERAGLIGSMALRHDEGAREALAAIANDGNETPEVRAVAQRAGQQLREGNRTP